MSNLLGKTILGLLITVIIGIGAIMATAIATNTDSFRFVSSTKANDSVDGADGANATYESQENFQLEASAKITANDAKTIAMNAVDLSTLGNVTNVQLENEDGNAVYAVEFTNGNIQTDVKVDAVTGKVVLVENGSNDAQKENSSNSTDELSGVQDSNGISDPQANLETDGSNHEFEGEE